MKIRPDELTVAIMAELENYSQEVADGVKDAVKESAKQCVKEIKAKSPENVGEYKSGWKYRIEHEDNNNIRISVYNSKRPSMTHLLEFGHAKSRGTGRIEGVPHIYPAQESARKKLENLVKVKVMRK